MSKLLLGCGGSGDCVDVPRPEASKTGFLHHRACLVLFEGISGGVRVIKGRTKHSSGAANAGHRQAQGLTSDHQAMGARYQELISIPMGDVASEDMLLSLHNSVPP